MCGGERGDYDEREVGAEDPRWAKHESRTVMGRFAWIWVAEIDQPYVLN